MPLTNGLGLLVIKFNICQINILCVYSKTPFKTHCRHCVVSLSKILYPLLSTGSSQEDRKLSVMTEKVLTKAFSIVNESSDHNLEICLC